MKPRIRLIAGRPIAEQVTKLELARKRFGRPFAHQPGSDWKPRATPVLTEWLQSRNRA